MDGPGIPGPQLKVKKMQRTRVSFALLVATLLASVLGSWLALTGLALRFFGAIPAGPGWIGILARLAFGPDLYSGLPVDTQAWLRIVVGTALAGGMTGLWLRQGWAFRSTLLLSVIALPFSGPSLIAVPLLFACLSLPSTRRRIQPALETNASQVSA